MKITESKMMPHPGGFGWGFYSRVRALAPDEAMPGDAAAAPDDTPESDWALAPVPSAPPAAVAPREAQSGVTPTGASGPTNAPADKSPADSAEGK